MANKRLPCSIARDPYPGDELITAGKKITVTANPPGRVGYIENGLPTSCLRIDWPKVYGRNPQIIKVAQPKPTLTYVTGPGEASPATIKAAMEAVEK